MAGLGLCCQDSGERRGVQRRRVERTQDHLILTQIPCRVVASGPRALGAGHRAEHTEATAQTLPVLRTTPSEESLELCGERGQNGMLGVSPRSSAPVPC